MNRVSQGQGAFRNAPEDDQRQRVDAASSWVQAVAPELCVRPGQPCSFAISAALEMRRRRGEGNVTLADVKELRAENLRRLGLAEFVDDPTGGKVTA